MNNKKRISFGLTFIMVSGIILMLLAFAFIASSIGYTQFTESFTVQYNDSAYHTALTAASLVDGDKIDEYLETGFESDEYAEIWNRMDRLCQTQDVTLIYVIKVDTTDYNSFLSVFNTVNDSSGYTPWEVGYFRNTTNEEYRIIYKDIYEEGLQKGTIVRTSGLNGRMPHITMLIPIKDSAGNTAAILCVERPMSELDKSREDYLAGIAIATVFITALAAWAAIYVMRRGFVIPIKTIKDESTRFAYENVPTSETELDGISHIREINELGGAIEKMEQDTLTYISNLEKATAERERINTELALATRIQANILPNTFPAFPDRNEFDIYASMTPAKEVGGDFYDFFLVDDDHLGLVIADVSGKGIPAALFMMMSKILTEIYAKMGLSPAQVLSRLNSTICTNNKDNMFVTVWFAVLEISSGKLTAANAGHEYPLLRRGGGNFEVFKDKHGFVIGGMDGMKYREYEIQLEKGDTIFVYTDGVAEATDESNNLFGLERMVEALNLESDASPEKLLENMNRAVNDFVGDAPQFDDLTMLGLKYCREGDK